MPAHETPSTGDRTRRGLLRDGAGLLAAGAATLSAGCAGSLPPLGTRQRFGRVDTPGADPPEYRQWLPAPAAVGAGDLPHYPFLFRRPGALDYPAPVRFTTPRKRLLSDLDYFGVGYANYARLLQTGFGTVLVGGDGFDPATVADTLTASGYAPDGRYEGADRYARSDVRRRALVTDEAVVWSSERVHPRPTVEALLDAREGRVRRYHESDDVYRQLSETVGESRMVEFVPPDGERAWTKCEGFRFDGDVAYHVMAFRYPEGMAVPEADLRRRSRRGTVLTREVDESELGVDGQLVVVEGRIPPEEGIPPEDIHPPYPPQVTWGVSRDDAAGTVSLRHEAGDTVPTDHLHLGFEVAVGDDLRDALDVPVGDDLWDVPETAPLPTVLEELGPGDVVTLDRENVPDVRVIPPDDIDFDAEDPYAAADLRPADRIELRYSPAGSYRPVFTVELEGEV